jgi:hypothetical protein
MKKEFCDKCGKELGKGWMGMSFWRINIFTHDAYNYDLCNSCKKQFERWLKNDPKD